MPNPELNVQTALRNCPLGTKIQWANEDGSTYESYVLSVGRDAQGEATSWTVSGVTVSDGDMGVTPVGFIEVASE